MNLIVDDHLLKFRPTPNFTELPKHGVALRSQSQEGHIISWADHVLCRSHSCLETGFFRQALHLDNIGLYHECSLNFPQARKEIESYEAPKPWQSLGLQSKFGQPAKKVDWEGVVIVTQYANDRSIAKVGSVSQYYEFIRCACAYFGKKAFLKIHPVISGDRKMLEILKGFAMKHGCEMGHVDVSVIDHCESVHLYNSSFAVDAVMRDKHVFQSAPGYFWQTGIVQYTHGRVHEPMLPTSPWYRDKFMDFLAWRYCWHELTPLPEVMEIMGAYAHNASLFPLPQDFSYGAYLMRNS